jgi:hypothetical protein
MSSIIKQHAMNTYWEIGGIAPRILNLCARCEWSASRPGHFIPEVNNNKYNKIKVFTQTKQLIHTQNYFTDKYPKI